MKRYLLGRLREPSTWRALIWLGTSFGLALNPDQASAIVAVGSLLAGGTGVLTPDRLFADDDKRVPHGRDSDNRD